MKLTKTLICAAVAGAMAFAASKASAFPLYLQSISGTVTVTTNYSTIASNGLPIVAQTKYLTKSFNLKSIYSFVTNVVYQNTGTNVPAKSQIAWDPYTGNVFLTNSSGYYQSLSGIVYMTIEDIATSFKGTAAGTNSVTGSESDVITDYMYVEGYDSHDLYFDIYQDYGTGVLTYSVNGKTGIGKMTVVTKGGESGEYLSSNDGVSNFTAVWSGTGKPQWVGPYSTWWY